MLKTVIVDDETENIDLLKLDLSAHADQIQVVDTFNDPFVALQFLKENKIDLLFLDISMPQMTGFEMLEKLEKYDFDVVFVTAYDGYALKAFEFCAIDYLLKPISVEKLDRAIERLLQKNKKMVDTTNLEMLLANMKGAFATRKKIAVPTFEGLEFLETEDILYVEADGAYSRIFLANNEKILVSKTLKDIENLLKVDNFARVHQSHIVNFLHVKRYIKGEGGTLILNNGKALQVSRANKVKLMNMVKFQKN